MNRKTVDSILKGVAGVSLAFGGVSVLSDANLVYASEVEQPEETTQEESSSEVTEPEESSVVDETPSTESDQSDSGETEESAFKAEREAFIAGQPEDTCTMSTAAGAMKNAAEAIEKAAQETAQEDTPTDEEGSEGESVSEGENTTQTLKDDDTDQNQTEDNVDQNQTEGNAENQATDAESQKKIEELKAAVDAAQKKVDDNVAAAKNGKIDASYYRAADELVKAMIEYYAAVEGFDGDINFTNGYCNNKWVSNGIDHNNNFKQNYLETTYTSGDMQDIVYYDYVNADKDGNILTGTSSESDATQIDHIVVLEKTPIFAVDGENDLFTFERDEFRNIIAYIVNGEKIDVIVNESGERVIAESVDEEGAVVSTTVTGNNASGYTVTRTKSVTNADGSTEQTTLSKIYTVLKGFSGENGGKGEVYKKDLVKDDNGGTETPQPETPSPEPSTPEAPQPETPSPEPSTPETPQPETPSPEPSTPETPQPETPSPEPSTPETPQPETPSPEPSAPEAPQSETQETEIADEDVPLSDVADVIDEDTDLDDEQDADEQDEDLTDLEDEEVPLAVLDLDEPVDIPDEDVPLSENPETGDAMTATWLGTAAASVAGLFGASRKKRKG